MTRHTARGHVACVTVVVEKHFQPTFLGRYRLDRLVVAHDDVTIWEAMDAARGIPVQLSIFERGSTVTHHGRSEGGMFVAVGDGDEEQTWSEPKARRRAWPWAVAGLACAMTALAGWYVSMGRAHPIGETTITAAELPPPPVVTATTTTVPPPPEPTIAPVAPIVTAPVAPPQRHEAAPASRPKLPAPKFVKPPHPQTPPPSFEPLTI